MGLIEHVLRQWEQGECGRRAGNHLLRALFLWAAYRSRPFCRNSSQRAYPSCAGTAQALRPGTRPPEDELFLLTHEQPAGHGRARCEAEGRGARGVPGSLPACGSQQALCSLSRSTAVAARGWAPSHPSSPGAPSQDPGGCQSALSSCPAAVPPISSSLWCRTAHALVVPACTSS